MSKILIIEDAPESRELLEEILKEAGHQVVSSADGLDGLSRIRADKPDLILLDLMLPKVDGYHVYRLIKCDAKFISIPVIVLTACVQTEASNLGLDVGSDFFLQKPIDSASLLAAIDNLVK